MPQPSQQECIDTIDDLIEARNRVLAIFVRNGDDYSLNLLNELQKALQYWIGMCSAFGERNEINDVVLNPPTLPSSAEKVKRV